MHVNTRRNEGHQKSPPSSPIATIACDQCYRRKQACTKKKPICGRCSIDRRHCTYSQGRCSGRPRKSSISITTQAVPHSRSEEVFPVPGPRQEVSHPVHPNGIKSPEADDPTLSRTDGSGIATPSAQQPELDFTPFDDQSFWLGPDLEMDLSATSMHENQILLPPLHAKENMDQEKPQSNTITTVMNTMDDANFPAPGFCRPLLGPANCGCVVGVLEVMYEASDSVQTQIRAAVDACERLIMCDNPHNTVSVVLLVLSAFQMIDDSLSGTIPAHQPISAKLDRKDTLRATMVLSALDLWTGSGPSVPSQTEDLRGFIRDLQQRLRVKLELG